MEHYVDFTSIHNNGSGEPRVTLSKVYPDKIDLPALSKALFAEPKVVEQPKPTLDQQVTSALSRLQVSLDAECDWAIKKIRQEFAEARRQQRCLPYVRVTLDPFFQIPMHGSVVEVLSFRQPSTTNKLFSHARLRRWMRSVFNQNS